MRWASVIMLCVFAFFAGLSMEHIMPGKIFKYSASKDVAFVAASSAENDKFEVLLGVRAGESSPALIQIRRNGHVVYSQGDDGRETFAEDWNFDRAERCAVQVLSTTLFLRSSPPVDDCLAH